MRLSGKTASTLLIWVGLLMAGFASPARAAAGDDFEGSWDTVIKENNAHFWLYLRQDGNKVEGSFANQQDPKYNGTIQGTVKNGRFSYSYVQPNVKGEGYGYFTIRPDYTITGLTTPGRGLGLKQYLWEGKPTAETVAVHATPKPKTTQKGVKFTAKITGYDAPEGNDRCYLEPEETAAFLGVKEGDPAWKHLQGIGACDGQDFWVYDDGKSLEFL